MIAPAMARKEIAVSSGSVLKVYLKSVLAGVVAVLVAAAGLVGIFALIAGTMGGDVRPGLNLTWKTGITACLIFALGFAWQFRRTTKQPATPNKITSSASTRRG